MLGRASCTLSPLLDNEEFLKQGVHQYCGVDVSCYARRQQATNVFPYVYNVFLKYIDSYWCAK